MSQTLNLSHTQNLKPHNDESKESNNNSKFDAFAEELGRNWYDLIMYDKISYLTVQDSYQYLLLMKKTSS